MLISEGLSHGHFDMLEVRDFNVFSTTLAFSEEDVAMETLFEMIVIKSAIAVADSVYLLPGAQVWPV